MLIKKSIGVDRLLKTNKKLTKSYLFSISRYLKVLIKQTLKIIFPEDDWILITFQYITFTLEVLNIYLSDYFNN